MRVFLLGDAKRDGMITPECIEPHHLHLHLHRSYNVEQLCFYFVLHFFRPLITLFLLFVDLCPLSLVVIVVVVVVVVLCVHL